MASKTATKSRPRRTMRRELPEEASMIGSNGSAIGKRCHSIAAFPWKVLGDEPDRTTADAAILDVFLTLAAPRIRKRIDELAAMGALDFVVCRARDHSFDRPIGCVKF